MNKIIKNIFALFIVINFLLAEGIAGYAGSFLRFGTTAYSMGMGGGFTAAFDHGFPGYHNPASLGFLNDRNAIKLMVEMLPVTRQDYFQLKNMPFI